MKKELYRIRNLGDNRFSLEWFDNDTEDCWDDLGRFDSADSAIGKMLVHAQSWFEVGLNEVLEVAITSFDRSLNQDYSIARKPS